MADHNGMELLPLRQDHDDYDQQCELNDNDNDEQCVLEAQCAIEEQCVDYSPGAKWDIPSSNKKRPQMELIQVYTYVCDCILKNLAFLHMIWHIFKF